MGRNNRAIRKQAKDSPVESDEVEPRKRTFQEQCAYIKTLLDSDDNFKKIADYDQTVADLDACISKSIESTPHEDGPNWPDVFTDLSLSILPHVSKTARLAICKAFQLICHQVSEESFQSIVDVARMTKAEDLDQLDVASDADESDKEQENENEADPESESESGSDEGKEKDEDSEDGIESEDDENEELDDEIDDEFRFKLLKALGPAAGLDGEEESDDIMDEEAMAELDKSIAAVFKEKIDAKKRLKENSQQMSQIRIHSLGLLKCYALQKDIQLGRYIHLVKSLLDVIEQFGNHSEHHSLVDKATSILSILSTKKIKVDIPDDLGTTSLITQTFQLCAEFTSRPQILLALQKIIRCTTLIAKRCQLLSTELLDQISLSLMIALDKWTKGSDFIHSMTENNPLLALSMWDNLKMRIADRSKRSFKRTESILLMKHLIHVVRSDNSHKGRLDELLTDLYPIIISEIFHLAECEAAAEAERGHGISLLVTIYSSCNRERLPDFSANNEKLKKMLFPDEEAETGDTVNTKKRKMSKSGKEALKRFKQLSSNC